MKVNFSNIQDFCIENTTASKVFLMNQIIDLFVPLFQEEIDRKQGQFNKNLSDVKQLRSEVQGSATRLKKISDALKFEVLSESLMDKISYLFDYGVLYGNNRRIASDSLKSLESGNFLELQKQSGILDRVVYKNIKKVIT